MPRDFDVLVAVESAATPPDTGEPVAVEVSRSVCGGRGGAGEHHRPSQPSPIPDHVPGTEFDVSTQPTPTVLFRQAGDGNALHGGPDIGPGGGFAQPILHGLYATGFAARMLIRRRAGGAAFQIRNSVGAVMIDRGEYDTC